jgi:hypothetical protein
VTGYAQTYRCEPGRDAVGHLLAFRYN